MCNLEKVVALYKYTAQNADELSFDKDDVIKMISKEEPDWWKGELNGVVGLFPSNYVQVLCKYKQFTYGIAFVFVDFMSI